MRIVSVTMTTASKGTIYLTILLGLLSIKTEAQQTRWSECSRTCGGGVKHILNGCLQFGPNSECLLFNKSYVSCNLQPCPASDPDFRTSQCEKYNKKMFNGTYYEWIPYFPENNCELYCQAKGKKFYYRHAERVVDGTPCGYDSTGICIEGTCTPVGCDKILGSTKRYDSCMVCGGDGSTCEKFERMGEVKNISTGYSTLFTLPKASTSIRIEKIKGGASMFLAVSDSKGNYLLNGNYVVAPSKMLILGGAVFNYSRLADGVESLRSLGPTREDLIIKIVVASTTRHFVHFEYYMPHDLSHDLVINRDFKVDTDQASRILDHQEAHSFTVTVALPHSGDYLNSNSGLSYGVDDDDDDEAEDKKISGHSEGNDSGVDRDENVEEHHDYDEYEGEDKETTVEEKEDQDGEEKEYEDVDETEDADEVSAAALTQESLKEESAKENHNAKINEDTVEDDYDKDDDRDNDSGSADDISGESSPAPSKWTPVSPHKQGDVSGFISAVATMGGSDGQIVKGYTVQIEGGSHVIEIPVSKQVFNGSGNFSVFKIVEFKTDGIVIDTGGDSQVEVIDRSAEVEDNEIGGYFLFKNDSKSQLPKAEDVDAESSGEGIAESVDRESSGVYLSGKESKTGKDETKVTDTKDKEKETPEEVDDRETDKHSGSSEDGDSDAGEDGDESSAAEEKPATQVTTEIHPTKTSTLITTASSTVVMTSSVKATTARIVVSESTGSTDDEDEDDGELTGSGDYDDKITAVASTSTASPVDQTTTKQIDLVGKKDEKEDEDDAGGKEETGDKKGAVDKEDGEDIEDTVVKQDVKKVEKDTSEDKDDTSGGSAVDSGKDDEETSSGKGIDDDSEDDDRKVDVTVKAPEVAITTKATEATKVTELTKLTEATKVTELTKVTETTKVTELTKVTEPSIATKSVGTTMPKKVIKPTKKTKSTAFGSGKTDSEDYDYNGSGSGDDDDEYGDGDEDVMIEHVTTTEALEEDYDYTTVAEVTIKPDILKTTEHVTTPETKVDVTTKYDVTLKSDKEDYPTTSFTFGEGEDEKSEDQDKKAVTTDVETTESTMTTEKVQAVDEAEVTTAKKQVDVEDTSPAAVVTEKPKEEEKEKKKEKEKKEKEKKEKEKKEKEKKEKEKKEKEDKKKKDKDVTTVAPDQTFTPRPMTPPKDEREEDVDKEPGKDISTGSGGLLINETIVPEEAATVQTPVVIEPPMVCPDAEHDFSKFKEVVVREKYTRWYVGKWTACENGVQEREVLCIVHDENENITITENQKRCSQPKPATLQRCHGDYVEPDQTVVDRTTARSCVGDVCQEFEWVVSDWFGCSRSCEEELDSRLAFCAMKSGPNNGHFTVSEDHCRLLDKPIEKRECQRQEIACEMKPKWFATQWGECSSRCGIGTQVRHIFCGRIHRQMVGDTIVITHPESCEQETKLESIQFCKTDCSARWVTGPFGECSVSCGGGIQIRQVVCLQGHLLSNDCDINNKPQTSHDCNYHTCPAVCPVIRCSVKCPHGYSADNNGCEICQCTELPQVFPELPCETSTYGCCPDGITPARGFGSDRCRQSDPIPPGLCIESMFGCCPDGVTSARGYNYFGCFEEESKKKEIILTGGAVCTESEEGSGEITCTRRSHDVINCQATEYGCCPDGITIATGYFFEGCEGTVDCRHQPYGCCGDGFTVAQGPDRFGCPEYIPPRQHIPQRPCNEHFYGCCLDGIGAAVGPNFEGCDEHNMTTHLTFQVDCADTEYGCCLDGKTPASGPHHAGCPHEHRRGGICYLPSEAGTCSNHTIKWYYDPSVGDCQRFWYSGCGTNGNLFESEEDCRAVCVTPPDHDKCFLPKVIGRCRAAMPRYFYNVDTQSCESFSYSGCDGNKNNFESVQSCDLQCTHPLKHNVCNLPAVRGPCRGSFIHWYFDAQSQGCQQFYYGGCLGNENRFETYEDCQSRCNAPIGDLCNLEPDAGPCHSVIPVWHFNSTTDTCERFYYGGCRGNLNRFTTRQKCQDTCLLPKKESSNICQIPHDVGLCSGYFEKWYHDPTDGFCKKFIYSGCGGSLNKFDSELDCRTSCNAREPIVDDICSLQWDTGPCTNYTLMYYFNKEYQVCDRFYYGGCEGNLNKYHSEEECLQRCVHLTPTEHTSHVETPTLEVSRKCTQPPEHGPCRKSFARWHYNSESRTCTMFQYGGCEGNENRFMSELICLRNCHPDHYNERSFDYSMATESEEKDRFMEETPDGSIEVGQGHVQTETGVTYDVTDEEISSVTHPAGVYYMCHQSSDPGSCYEWEVMWYYSVESGQCLQFWYGGCGGNDNRFQSEEECMARCITSNSPQSPHPEPPYHGDVQSREDHREDNRQPEPGAMEAETPTGSVCSLLSNSGPCSDYQIKWYYNEDVQQCAEFYYGGCEGNGNRFETREECEATCRLVVETERPRMEIGDFCHQPMELGQCNSRELKFYWDSAEEQCRPFYYTGCQGNQNNFDTSEHCYHMCGLNVKEEHRLTYTKESCYQPREAGPCYDFVVRYYFDTEENDCRGFYYGGCKGNHNTFHSYEDCHAVCMPQPATHVCPPVEPCDPYSCQGDLRYVRDEHGCERCQCDQSVAAPTVDVGKQEYNLNEEAVFTCYGQIEPGNVVSIVRDGEPVTSIVADQHSYAKVQFMIERSGAYRCVIHLTSGYTVQSQDMFVEVHHSNQHWQNEHSNGHSSSSENYIANLENHRTTRFMDDLHVELTANGQWFNVGDEIIITCMVRGLPKDEEITIAWEKDREEILVQREGVPDDGIFQIKIEKAESGDTGVYMCHVSMSSGLVIDSPSLYIPPLYTQKNSLSIEMSKTLLQRGREYFALCLGNVGPGIAVLLRRDDQDVAFAQLSADGRASLKFVAKHSGHYRCMANVDHQIIESGPVFVSVLAGDIHVELHSSKTDYEEGSSILFTCKIFGIEDYSRGFQAVFRHYNGDVLLKEFHSKQEGTEHSLTLDGTSYREAGRYTCEAFPSDDRELSYYSEIVDITVRPAVPDEEECVDKSWYADCRQVVQGRYCSQEYFRKFCCRSCRNAGLI